MNILSSIRWRLIDALIEKEHKEYFDLLSVERLYQEEYEDIQRDGLGNRMSVTWFRKPVIDHGVNNGYRKDSSG